RQADLVARDLGAARGPDRLLDPLGEQREIVVADRPALAGATNAGDDLVPAERFGDPAALDHRERGLLDGREAPAAPLPVPPPPPDRRALVGLPRVDDARVGVAAVRTAHCSAPPPSLSCGWAWGRPVDRLWSVYPNLWTTYTSVSTRCSGRR